MLRPLACALLPALALAGCAATPAEDDGRLSIVAVTDVYGDIAATVAGDAVEVTSIISGPNQDPHSYEATARDQLLLSQADLVIANGGGYDPFIDRMLEASGRDGVVVLTAVEVAGLTGDDEHAAEEHAAEEHATDEQADDEHGHGHIEGVDEHVWYSLPAMAALAHSLADELVTLDPANATAYHDNAEGLEVELLLLSERLAGLAGQGGAVVATELVPMHLLVDAGLTDATPAAFAEAVEEGSEVSPGVLLETLELVASADVRLLAYNSQTAGQETERVREAAEAAGVPVLEFTENLPEGADYVEWMTANVDQLERALAQ